MVTIQTIDEEFAKLKKHNEHGAFVYDSPSKIFSSICKDYFGQIKRPDKHGVYLIRQKFTGQVLYVGKSGTINSQGIFDKQDIPGRLTNVKGKITANEWFKTLVSEKGA